MPRLTGTRFAPCRVSRECRYFALFIRSGFHSFVDIYTRQALMFARFERYAC